MIKNELMNEWKSVTKNTSARGAACRRLEPKYAVASLLVKYAGDLSRVEIDFSKEQPRLEKYHPKFWHGVKSYLEWLRREEPTP